MDTDSHGNRVKPFRDAVFERYTTTLSTWDLYAPPTALDFCRIRRCEEVVSDWKRDKKLDDNDRVCHETRSAGGHRLFRLCFDHAGSMAVFELAC